MRRATVVAGMRLATVLAMLLSMPRGALGQGAPAETYTLGRAIAVGLANSITLDEAEFGREVADQMVREAWSSVLPDLSANVSYSRNLMVQEIFLPAFIFDSTASPDDLVPVKVGSDNQWQAFISASQPLFDTRAFIGVGAAGRFRALQHEMVRGTTQQVVSGIRQWYFAALLAAEELRLTEQSIRRVRQTLEETRAMNRAGLVSDYDVLRIEVQLSNLEANVRRAENAATAGKRRVLVEMGLDVDMSIGLAGRLGAVDLDDPAANDPDNAELLSMAGAMGAEQLPYEDLVRVALRRRSDLRQLRSGVLVDEARVAVERAQFFPTLSIFSSYNVAAQDNGSPSFFGEGPKQRTTSAAAGFRLEVPIFRGFSRSARVQQARATVRQNEARLERAGLVARNQVRTLLDNVREARQRAASQQRAVEQARRGFEIASAEYRAGLGSQLQITDAEVALRESEFNYARAVYDYLMARSQLDLALGTVPETAGELRAQGQAR